LPVRKPLTRSELGLLHKGVIQKEGEFQKKKEKKLLLKSQIKEGPTAREDQP